MKKIAFILVLFAFLLIGCTEEAKVYTVTFNSNGGSAIVSVEVEDGKVVPSPANPDKEGYDFDYWYVDNEGVSYSFSTPVTEDLTLTAKWTIRSYTVSFVTNGGTVVENQTVNHGGLVSEPTDPSKEGYTFVYWFIGPDQLSEYDFSTPVTSNLEITAGFNPNVVTYTFDSMGGTLVDPVSDVYNGMINEPTEPTKEGHVFDYWYVSDPNVEFTFGVPTSDLTLYAKWTINTYDITFDSQGGSSVDAQMVDFGSLVSEPTVPSRDGYEFLYWYTDNMEVAYDFSSPVASDLVLNAAWEELIYYDVTFNAEGGTEVLSQSVLEGENASVPLEPTKEGLYFGYWYVSDPEVPYDFSTPVVENLVLHAKWDTVEDLIDQDLEAFMTSMFVSDSQLNLMTTGLIHQSAIKWTINSQYITNSGYVLPLNRADLETQSAQINAEFTLFGVKVQKTVNIPLSYSPEVVISEVRSVPFTNLTTEYNVSDGALDLYFEQNGNVPYVSVIDFLNLLEGFVDPEVDFTITYEDDSVEIFYQYYDEDDDTLYDLIVTIDAATNTITTNDPGFYWAYVYSTETNYGRHINYDQDNPDSYSEDGEEVVFEIEKYNMDMAVYDNKILLPYFLVNQLFAGSSYYNVYYNYDGLYGIYSLPSSGSVEYRTIKRSSLNNTDVPFDVLQATFDMMAFNLDYFYGLQDIMSVDTYYDLLYAQVNKFFNQDPEALDIAIAEFLLKTLDEPHTSYGYSSYYNNRLWSGPPTNSLSNYGPRFVEWYYDGFIDVDDVIAARWNITDTSGWAASSPKRPYFWSLDDKTVMLSLDDFYTSDIEESASYDVLIPTDYMEVLDASLLLPDVVGGTKFFYYNNSSETNRLMEILIKGLDANYLTTYHDALIADGYTYVFEASTDDWKQNGYFTKTVIAADTGKEVDTTYMVQIDYDADLGLFYIGIMDKAPTLYSGAWPFIVNIMDMVISDSAVYMEMMLDQITAQYPLLENIILDLSWNTGGNVGALYRIVGFITDQPFRVSGIDGDTGGVSSYYVYIDGVPNYSHLNWSLLITPVTFSAANSMATIFMENDLGPIIGKQSGGGACSITPVLLPNGTAFTMSSNNINAYRIGTGTPEDPYEFIHNEFGIAPDFPIDITQIYNATTLLGIIYGDQ